MTIIIRATQGNLAEADSNELDFTCVDPCLDTEITPIMFPNEIQTSVLRGTPEIFSFPIDVTDSVSLKYTDMFGDGTGYDICGDRSYEVLERNPDSGNL